MRALAGLVSTLVLMLVSLPVGAGPAGADEAPAPRHSKRDLAQSYKPFRVAGVDWYRSVGAARLRADRLRRTDRKDRLILQMRMLGPMDGST